MPVQVSITDLRCIEGPKPRFIMSVAPHLVPDMTTLDRLAVLMGLESLIPSLHPRSIDMVFVCGKKGEKTMYNITLRAEQITLAVGHAYGYITIKGSISRKGGRLNVRAIYDPKTETGVFST